MTRIFSYTQPIEADIVDAYCALQKGFTDQFVYYRKDRPVRFMGMGRCIALPALDGIECELEGPVGQQPVFFSFNRFDAENPSPTDELFEAFPRLKFMLPEVILVEDDREMCIRDSLNKDFYGEGIDIADAEPQHLFEIGRQGVCGVLAGQRGLIAQYAADYPEINYLVKMNSKTNIVGGSQDDPYSPQLYDLDAVLAMREAGVNIVGIGYTIYLGSEYESTMMAEAGERCV